MKFTCGIRKYGWHIHGEWICDADNLIVKKPLSFWFEHFGIVPATWRDYEMWRSEKTGKYIDIERHGGYGLRHSEYENYKDKLFFVGNADLDSPKLRQSMT